MRTREKVYMIEVYRFRGCVALTGSAFKETLYLKPQSAEDLALALKEYAEDVAECEFTSSTLGVTSIDEDEGEA